MNSKLQYSYFIIFCIFSLCTFHIDAPVNAQNSNTSIVNNIEKQLYGYTNTHQSLEERLKNIEYEILGQAQTDQDIDTRISKLQDLYDVPEEPVPHELVYKQPQTKPNTNSAQSSNGTANPYTDNNTVDNPRPEINELILKDDLTHLSQDFLRILNKERELRQLSQLKSNVILDIIANEHASYLVQTKQLSHYGYNNSNPDIRYSQAGGDGAISEVIEGFFAQNINTNDAELPHHLMDAILEKTDQSDKLFNTRANVVGISFVVSPDKDQLAVVIEIGTDSVELAKISTQTTGNSLRVSGRLLNRLQFGWVGVGRIKKQDAYNFETKPSIYLPPIDQVIYVDKTGDRAKAAAQIGALVLGTVAAPFTYGTSMIIADAINRKVSQTQQLQDVDVKGGINANKNGYFTGNVNLKAFGEGYYYITVWAIPFGSNATKQAESTKPFIVSRRVVEVN